MTYSVLQGDVLDVLPTFEAESFDAMLTDPPYGLEFMGKSWDGVVPDERVWRETLRVLKPGAFALVFGGTRTFHRLAVALEGAGFEVRDTLMWVFGGGFPKSHDVSKAIDRAAGAERRMVGEKRVTKDLSRNGLTGDMHVMGSATPTTIPITAPATPEAERWQGYGTALKPAYEPVLLVRKPTPLTHAQNALEHGTGALNIDGTRVPTNETLQGSTRRDDIRGGSYGLGRKEGGRPEDIPTYAQHDAGRWPANLIHDGSEEVVSLFPRAPGQQARVGPEHGPRPSVGVYGDYGPRQGFPPRNDSGSAARFFYAAKADTAERNAGLEDRNPHPTVKPLALTEYLARLLLPPPRDTPRRILVPFAGSGSEVIGALKAGWDEAVGIEREPEYAAIAETRLAHWTKGIQLGLAFLEAV